MGRNGSSSGIMFYGVQTLSAQEAFSGAGHTIYPHTQQYIKFLYLSSSSLAKMQIWTLKSINWLHQSAPFIYQPTFHLLYTHGIKYTNKLLLLTSTRCAIRLASWTSTRRINTSKSIPTNRIPWRPSIIDCSRWRLFISSLFQSRSPTTCVETHPAPRVFGMFFFCTAFVRYQVVWSESHVVPQSTLLHCVDTSTWQVLVWGPKCQRRPNETEQEYVSMYCTVHEIEYYMLVPALFIFLLRAQYLHEAFIAPLCLNFVQAYRQTLSRAF